MKENLGALKEAYFDLEKSRQQERNAKELGQLLLDGITIVSDQSDSSASFEKLFLLLNKNIEMDNYCILQVFPRDDSEYNFKSFYFKKGISDVKNDQKLPMFLTKKFDQKRISNIFDLKEEHGVNEIFNLTHMSNEDQHRSALISPINTNKLKYLIIITSKQKSKFTPSHSHLVKKFTPIFSQAFEMNQLIVDIIMKNKLASFGELSAGIAHEINNPLTILKTNFALMKRYLAKGDNESIAKIASYLESSEGIVNRIGDIVKGFRVLARDEQIAKKDELSLETFIVSVQGLCAGKLSDSDISFNVCISEELQGKLLRINAVQLSQVMVNLILNSIDAIEGTDERWIKIKISEQDSLLKVTVVDGGTGIASDIFPNIFQPFFTTKEIGKGTGLGLSISRNIIKSMGGELIFDQGQFNTCFSFLIPLLICEQKDSDEH